MKENLNLEKTLDALEKIVKELEGGHLSLEDSLKKFEEGVVLYKKSKNVLVKVEDKIKILNDSLNESDFDDVLE